jgi:predicted transposase YbfD/YdcC
MDYIREKFSIIEDKRHPSYIEHNLSDILIIIMCSVLCGLDGLAEICALSVNKARFFKEKYGIEQIPSKPTFSRILNLLDGDAVAAVIVEIMLEKAKFMKNMGNILAVDGKAIRSTSKKGHPHSALQILTACLTESGVVLGQKSIHEKTNEIPVFQEMLKTLNVQGLTVTADAMHCQKETCKKITEKGGHYVFGLKENQKLLYEDVALFFNERINKDCTESFSTTEKNGGRIEKRICTKITDISWLSAKDEWIGLKVIFSVRRITTTKHAAPVSTRRPIRARGFAGIPPLASGR